MRYKFSETSCSAIGKDTGFDASITCTDHFSEKIFHTLSDKDQKEIEMSRPSQHAFPRWLFALLAIGGLIACGIYLGVMSVESFSVLRLVQTAGFGVFGLVMLWGALHTKGYERDE